MVFTFIRCFARRRAALAVLLAGLSPAGHALTFDGALRLAETHAPQLKASEESLAAARSLQIPAGALPDPRLVLGVDNLPIEGTDRYSLTRDAMTMQRIGLMQEFPNAAKREARVAAAQGQVALSEAEARIARLTVLRETAVAWIARHSVERQLARIDALTAENRLLASAVRAELAGGQGSPADIVAPRQEAALIDERRDALRAQQAQAIAALRRWIGAAADAPLEGGAPAWPLQRDTLEHRLHHHPELLAFDSRARVLDAGVAEAQAAKRPDWALEMDYQHRARQYGDMVSLQVSFDLPVFSGTRQNPKIAAARAERARLDAEREATLREHAAMLASDFADYQRLTAAVERQREILLPLAQEKVDLAMAAWRGGKGRLTELVAARRERIDAELKAIALEGEQQQTATRLHYAYGDGDGADPHTGEHP
ncbi:MAG: hypothetical protein BGP20_00725 [Thiobacillus sp. 63-78]|nr:MAG: hypothetical protein BGP20_00725 [Thiobacillus sp. 63-78]